MTGDETADSSDDEEDDDDEVDEEDDQPMASGSTSSNWISKPQVMRTYQSRQTAPFRSLTNRERRGETSTAIGGVLVEI